MDTKQGIILVGIGLLLLWASVETASAKTWYVNDDGGADFTKIQDAIHNASSGDTIIVYEGAYCENIAVPKSLTIVGEKISYLVASTYAYCVHITADNVTVKGFTVRNHKDGYGGFLIKDVNNCVIAENMIEIDRGSGFDISGGDNISVIDNVISVNRFSGLGADRITDSIIHSNSITGGGIFLYGSNYNEVSGNTISSTLWGAIGIGTYNSEGSCHNLISDNIIKNTTKEGISLGSGSNFNEVYNNTIDSSESGLGLSEISNYNIIKNNTVHARYVNFEDTYFNKIYQNNFIDCDVTDEGNTNS
ncbi:right-handed parallel beta-helix repeat-containing protein, partial [candidate division WOR-3 bacterium]|nr:right-handed parallel beta-helix repeat-containing protein [candidate division WOR-3 bacterium]